MKLKYLILLGMCAIAIYYVAQDEIIRTGFQAKIHQILPELNQSTLYKWQNNKGEWQITDKPPAHNIPFITVDSQDQINVMPSPSSNKKK